MLWAKFGCIWRKVLNVSVYFRYYLQSGNSMAFPLNKFENPLPKDALCQVWLKLAQWSWRKRFLNVVNAFLLFCYYLPLEKGVAPNVNKLKSLSPNDLLCHVQFKLAQLVVLETKMKMWKVNRQLDGQTYGQTMEDRWSEKITSAYSSGEQVKKLPFI